MDAAELLAMLIEDSEPGDSDEREVEQEVEVIQTPDFRMPPIARPVASSGGKTNLLDAHRQWASRPDDERFWTLEEMYEQCRHWRATASEHNFASIGELSVLPDEDTDDIKLCLPNGMQTRMTHWGFSQLCSRVGAPANYLREQLDAETASMCLNHGLRKAKSSANVLVHSNGTQVCRSLTTEKYSRIWNAEVLERLMRSKDDGWRVPPARAMDPRTPGARIATAEDILDTSINVSEGDWIGPAGLYASDHDMFVFMVNEEYRIDDGTDGGLSRGFFISNSEVGAAALKLTKFLYRHVCGNHIVWDAKDVEELRIVHRGRANRRFEHNMRIELRKYANESMDEDRRRITQAKNYEIAADKDAVLDALFGLRVAPRQKLESAWELAEYEADLVRDISPRSAWGMAQGLTRLSQQTNYTDERMALDRAAGKVLSMAF